jgi:hypothetical protein
MLHATSLRPRPNTYRENLDLREHSYTTYMDARTVFLHFGKPLRTESLENRSPDASSTTFTSLSHDISLPKDQKFFMRHKLEDYEYRQSGVAFREEYSVFGSDN